eukprot:8352951-Pyramimonas_sp.AAC.1
MAKLIVNLCWSGWRKPWRKLTRHSQRKSSSFLLLAPPFLRSLRPRSPPLSVALLLQGLYQPRVAGNGCIPQQGVRSKTKGAGLRGLGYAHGMTRDQIRANSLELIVVVAAFVGTDGVDDDADDDDGCGGDDEYGDDGDD